jgi:exodeoxyribonuclease V alpha subunit
LDEWAQQGWLRRLDSALPRLLGQLDPQATPTLLVAAALLAHMEGRGHTCLALAPLVSQPLDTLAWPAAAHAPLQTLWDTLPTAVGAWVAALRASALVRWAPACFAGEADVSPDPDQGQPLVLGGTASSPLLYLRRYWWYEGQVATALCEAAHCVWPVDAERARHCLDTLFGEPPEGMDVDWQKAACALALRGRLTVITGGPGTGKTYTAARLLALLLALHPQPAGLKVALAAPTGKAAARLRQSIEQSLAELQPRLGDGLDLVGLTQRIGPAKTLHALLGARPDTRQFQHDANHPLDVDVLIVDETSMVHLEMMAALLQALPPTARLVLLGDKDQLASVEAGAVLGDLCTGAEQPGYSADTVAFVLAASGERLPLVDPHGAARLPPLAQHTVMLRHSRRFGGAIGQLAQAVNAGRTVAAQALLREDASGAIWSASAHANGPVGPDTVLALAVKGRPGAPASYADYARLLAQRPPAVDLGTDPVAHTAWVKSVLRAWDHCRVLCAVHSGPWGDRELNQGIQRALARAGWLHPAGDWFVGRPVMVTRNDGALGVFNGDVGVVLPTAHEGQALRAYFLDGSHLRSVAVSRLAHVETAFAMTVHKSQGSEFQHTVLVLPPGAREAVSRELVYTGITRARTHLSLVEAEPGLLVAAIGQRLARASGLPTRLRLGSEAKLR